MELDDGVAVPVDFKKGKRPHVAAGTYEPERVQVCAQAMSFPGRERPDLIEAAHCNAVFNGDPGDPELPERAYKVS